MQDSISLNFYIASNPDWQQNSQDGINSMTVPYLSLRTCTCTLYRYFVTKHHLRNVTLYIIHLLGMFPIFERNLIYLKFITIRF